MFKLSPDSGVPLYQQLLEQVRHAVAVGALAPGDQLPGIRTLAEALVISPTTVARAYEELQAEGVIETRHGSGAYVASRRRRELPPERMRRAQHRVHELRERLEADGYSNREIRLVFEAELRELDDRETVHARLRD